MERIPMTPAGYQRLKEELDRLIKVERPKTIKAIEEARAHGDLSENAEYDAAKEKQAFLEGRIRDLQGKIARAQVIDPSTINHDKVAFGATVKIMDTETGQEKVFQIVGPEEADVNNGRVSIHSPIARALIGKEVGDIAILKAPARTIEYEVLEINFE